ncbi:MAG: glycosyltransferase family 2 protein [Neisseriaceae bacterium]|nr:MAG: glycosyltransferase family 2 protein [Neisseriaceae bacterium]
MSLTVIIPTNDAPIQTLEWSILSLLMNSNLDNIQEIIVSINGPDNRTGNSSLQDQKELFCKKLANAGYPITVLRTWSRIGFSGAVQSALSFVKTEYYLLMHDDVIVLNKDWQKELDQFENGADAIIHAPVFSNKLKTAVLTNSYKETTTVTFLPAINSSFSAFRTSCNFNWSDYYCWIKESDYVDLESTNSFYKNKTKAVSLLFRKETFADDIKDRTKLELNRVKTRPELVQYNSGSWVANDLINSNRVFCFSKVVHHLEGMNNKFKEVKKYEVDNPDQFVCGFLNDLKNHDLFKFYDFSLPKEKDFSSNKLLVCVLVYKRIENLKKWMDIWKKANKFGGKLLVVQNADNSIDCKEISKQIDILQPDYHWVRKNDNESMKHIFELLIRKDIVDFDWDKIVFFTDDCIPLREDFLMPFLDALEDVSLTGGVLSSFKRDEIDKEGYFQRSVCLGIKKEVLLRVRHKAYRRIKMRGDFIQPSLFSTNCERFIWNWAKEEGFEVGPTRYEWSKIFGWDCDHQKIDDLWDKIDLNLYGKYNFNDF